MGDLSTLDETKPADGDAAQDGDDAIRETRVAVKTSIAVEHDLTGIHKFGVGTTAARPAAGHAGRIYFNTDGPRIERDTGASWVIASDLFMVQPTGAITLSGVYQDVVSWAAVVPSLGKVLIVAQAFVDPLTSGTLGFRIQRNGVTAISSGEYITLAENRVLTLVYAETPGAGTFTYTADVNGGIVTGSCTCTMLVIVA